MSARREPRLEPGPWALLCRSEWSLVALAVGAFRRRHGEKVTPYSLSAWCDAMARPSNRAVALTWAGDSTSMLSLARNELRDWYAAGGELP